MPSVSKIAPIVAVALVAVVVLAAFLIDGGKKGGGTEVASGVGAGTNPIAQAAQQSNRPAEAGVPGGAAGNNAPSLEGLVGGLEAKVKADPGNVNNKLLLAQTYAELGRLDDGMKLVREAQASNGGDARVKLVSAMVLSKSDDPKNLKEALTLFGEVAKAEPAQKGQAILHKGRVQKKMGDVKAAKATWKDGVAQLPESDPLRKEMEKELAGS